MIPAFASLMTVLIVAGSPVEVRSATHCPSTEAIVERSLPLLPAAAAGLVEEQDVARIEVGKVQSGGATALHLVLLRADASVVGDRGLLMQGTCQDMAEAVATVIAAWETKPLSGDVPDDGPRPTLKEVAPMSQVQASEPASTRIQPWRIVGGAGAGAALVGGTAAIVGFDVLLGRSTSHWQLRLGLADETDRRLNFQGGHVDWQHTTAALGLCWHLLDPSWLLSLDVGPIAGWATLAGSNFSVNRKQRSFEYGVAAGLRAGRSFGRWTVWAEGRTNLWAQVQRATVTGDSSGAELPQVDTTVALGFSPDRLA